VHYSSYLYTNVQPLLTVLFSPPLSLFAHQSTQISSRSTLEKGASTPKTSNGWTTTLMVRLLSPPPFHPPPPTRPPRPSPLAAGPVLAI
jgi:hypothetical protein